MEPHYVITSRVSFKNGVLEEEIQHIPIPKDPLPWQHRLLRVALCFWLMLVSGFFDALFDNRTWMVELIIWCGLLMASFAVLYGIFKDCRASSARK